MEEGQNPQVTGEPVAERARIAGVEAGIAAGLVPKLDARTTAASEQSEADAVCASAKETPAFSGSAAQLASLAPYDLPDWTDPPTLQVPRIFLDLEQEAAAGRGGPPPPPPGGPVWRERQEDWNDADSVLAQLASTGPSVTDYEEPSSDDPFAYDFLDLDGEASWLAQSDTPETPRQPSRGDEPPPGKDETPEFARGLPEEPSSKEPDLSLLSEMPDHDEDTVPARAPRRRHVARRGRARVLKTHAAPGEPDTPLEASEPRALDSAAALESAQGSARNPVVATLTGVALAAILLLCFMAGPPAVLVLAVIAVTLAAAEFFHSLAIAGYRPATLLGLLGVPGVVIAAYFYGPEAIVAGFVIFIVAAMLWYLAGISRRSPLVNLSVTVFAFGWTGVLAAFAGLLVDPRIFPDRHGIAFMLGAIIAAVGYDIGGYVIGSRFGRHSLVPSVSPNKTWEGLVGGCAVAIAASAAITSQIHPWDVKTALVLGLIVAVVAPCGDLVESMIKRDLGVKDMGSLLPGHGGVMDRIDALLFVLPAAYYFIRLAHI
ncbi:MAG: phosphatidate cytidylyltransferase [Acidimicrobiales bacterium]